jgi:hypothetical protein
LHLRKFDQDRFGGVASHDTIRPLFLEVEHHTREGLVLAKTYAMQWPRSGSSDATEAWDKEEE